MEEKKKKKKKKKRKKKKKKMKMRENMNEEKGAILLNDGPSSDMPKRMLRT